MMTHAYIASCKAVQGVAQHRVHLVSHHLPDRSEASCIVQMRIYTEKLHAEQHQHSQGQSHQCLVSDVSLYTTRYECQL